MSLSCLTCQKIIRTDSEKDLRQQDGNDNNTKEEQHLGIFKGKVERASWSGNLAPRRPSYDKMRSSSSLVPTKKVKKTAHHRIHSSGSLESVDQFNVDEQPKLARSCGMRRDWSFEDLRHQTLKA